MQCVFACLVLLIILWICVLSAGIGLSDFLESPGIAIDNGVLLLIAAIAALLLLLLFAPAGWVAALITAAIRVGRWFFRPLVRLLKDQRGELKPSEPSVRINPQKQAGHIKGTPQYHNRVKQGTQTSYFDDIENAERLTREAWQNGTPIRGRPNVREYDFGRPIGRGPKGGLQTKVRVHMNSSGEIHGHPSGKEIFSLP